MTNINYQYHHMGIPTTEKHLDERYSSSFKMYTTKGHNPFRIQYHRFEEGCPLHPLIQTKVHVAFKVNDLAEAIKNQQVIMAPYEPFTGFKVAMIEVEGAPIELIETTLSEQEIWDDDHKNSVIYPENSNP
ncbi:hypothetical protein [Cysteiniphilum halobium]|uniref:hypothetical protein n=1 Tax=Cysteiniphilum halobium TaxID=2219059 RepID=UPI001F2640FB|nr:hypothetical protein [Cysteiniphilum halobium]